MIPLLLLLAVGVGQKDTRPCGLQANSLEIRDCATHPPQVKAAPGVDLVLQKNGDVIAQPAPLKCGKYEHWEDRRVERGKDPMVIIHDAGCWPDMHPLKESEYQEIMEQMRLMKKQIQWLNGPKSHWVPKNECAGNDVPGSNGCLRYEEMPSPER